MTGRNLPPLMAGASYQTPSASGLDFTMPDIARELRGEATALLKLNLANGTGLEVPVRAFQLQMLMSSLMRASPQQALTNLRLFAELEDVADAPGPVRGARKKR